MSHLNFSISAFSANFWSIKSDLSGNTVWPQALGFKIRPNGPFLAFFNELLSSQNANVARNVEYDQCDFFGDFQTFKT